MKNTILQPVARNNVPSFINYDKCVSYLFLLVFWVKYKISISCLYIQPAVEQVIVEKKAIEIGLQWRHSVYVT